MEVKYERCCGLDVHKQMVVCVIGADAAGKAEKATRTFGTMSADLRALGEWSGLRAFG